MTTGQTHPAPSRPQTMVTFSIGPQRLAVPATSLLEVMDPLPVTRVPGAGRLVPGVVNVRGSVVPFADLGAALGLPRGGDVAHHRFVVVEVDVGGDLSTVVIHADAVHEVASLHPEAILTASASLCPWPSEFLLGLYKSGDGFVILPDLVQVFSIRAQKPSTLSSNGTTI
jgi:purine-binding chemotaxis protein CheW